MPKPPFPAAGGAMPVTQTNVRVADIYRLSPLIADPFVSRAFERAEREDKPRQ